MIMRSETVKLFLREIAFRIFCKHRQGNKPNILLFCSRRGGSTWVLNTIAAHQGMRYVGRPFMTILQSRWRNQVPCLRKAGGYTGEEELRQIIHFEGEAERQFKRVAENVLNARWHIYPTLNFRAPYFHRKTDRVIFQMTSGLPMINWFDDNFDVDILYLVRHPIPNALSIMSNNWQPECFEFLNNQHFVDTHLTNKQVDAARRIEASNNLIKRHILDWCLKHLVPLKAIQNGEAFDWTLMCYEDLVVRPFDVVRNLANRLELPDVDGMLEQVQIPSRTVNSSTAEKVQDKSYLLSRWRNQVSSSEENSLMNILDIFGIEIYQAGLDSPTSTSFILN